MGYASFRKAGFSVDDEASATHFEIDTAIVEAGEDEGAALIAALEGQWAGFMSDSRCHCQFCDPTLDHARLAAELPLGDA